MSSVPDVIFIVPFGVPRSVLLVRTTEKVLASMVQHDGESVMVTLLMAAELPVDLYCTLSNPSQTWYMIVPAGGWITPNVPDMVVNESNAMESSDVSYRYLPTVSSGEPTVISRQNSNTAIIV